MPATESEVDAPPAGRLVIRVKLIPQEELPPPPPAPPRWSKTALLAIAGVVVVLLGWFAISTFRSDPTPAPIASNEPLPKPATEPAKVAPVEAAEQPDPPPSPLNKVIPDVPKSALATITGTLRVSVRVTLDKQGAVVDATAEDRGPSRYFERLAVDASKQWTFTPARLDEKRTMLVKFNFTRNGATANAE